MSAPVRWQFLAVKAGRRVAGSALPAVITAFACTLSATASAQDTFPAKPVVIVVPQAAGGANDTVARAFAQRLGPALGQSVVIENRTGAGGNVGTAHVARAPRDGYTLLLTAQSAQTINPALYRNPGFDPVADFAPIMTVATAPYLLVANPSFPAKSLKDLIDLARQRPGKIDYASAGNGTLNHLLGVMLNSAAGLHLVHIPYRGAAAAAADVVSGQVPITFGSFPGVMPFVKSGKLTVIGVATEKRTPLAPEVPTLAESLPGFFANSWYGLFAPAGTPKPVIDRILAVSTQVLSASDLGERLAGQGAEVWPGNPDQLAKLVREELVMWARIVKESGATVD
jgi:tripartite-type tricarboxylate transporter receptor subunit TctC